MYSLFDPTEDSQTIQRISKLTAATPAQWGKMNVAQMLVHARVALQTAFGEVIVSRSIMGLFVGGIAKKQILNDRQFKKNLPTEKRFVIADQRDFDQERTLSSRPFGDLLRWDRNGLPQETHPFFGKLTTQEWDKLMWKQLDHHLRQFGA